MLCLSRHAAIYSVLLIGCWLAPAIEAAKVSFELDILPVLTAHGCNSGACHGKQRGQNGFQLSLLAFDPDFDFHSLVRESRGRRLFPASPSESLLLLKATAQTPHGGGRQIEPDSADYQTLLNWIAEAAPRKIDGEPLLQSVSLAESEFSLSPSQQNHLRVTAHYDDGSERDVTRLATYLSNEASVVSVDPAGAITAGVLPGETAVMARYMNHICVANVSIPQPITLAPARFTELPRSNFIDDHVYAKLQKLSLLPSDPIDDATFLRRIYTDVIGRLPSPEEAREFLNDSDRDKRANLVDLLLVRPEYADHWAGYWADLLRPNPYRVGIKAVLNYDNWIREQFRANVSYDSMVRKLITAKGSTWHNGAATLYRDRRSPDEVATMVSQLFLGVRLECAKCHHHPFERWSQQDFYQFAAHFAKVGRKGTGLSPPISGGEEIVFTSTSGTVSHPLTGEKMSPKPLFGKHVGESEDPRDDLAQWMTSDENDYFAQVQVNRVWGILMGRGIVEPVDDLRSTNPPTNPQLLAALAANFRESGYDLKQLIRTITLSRTYSHSSLPNETNSGDRVNYSRHYRHRLRAEVLMDAVADVTEVAAKMQAMPAESRASQVWTHRVDSMFLDTFGRPNENQDPPCERTPDATVTQSLHLMNSPDIDSRIRSDQGRAARLAASELTASLIIEEVYLAIFSRVPTPAESDYGIELIESAEKRRTVIEDLMWAMMNAPEFTIQN
ncbi:MAG: DUF1549 and DUF1553 domain-containing protein [Rubripirellula sp.]|nr:DUF1549 and DUF1553 domain-containing protein [Rubripirellula sp.]